LPNIITLRYVDIKLTLNIRLTVSLSHAVQISKLESPLSCIELLVLLRRIWKTSRHFSCSSSKHFPIL